MTAYADSPSLSAVYCGLAVAKSSRSESFVKSQYMFILFVYWNGHWVALAYDCSCSGVNVPPNRPHWDLNVLIFANVSGRARQCAYEPSITHDMSSTTGYLARIISAHLSNCSRVISVTYFTQDASTGSCPTFFLRQLTQLLILLLRRFLCHRHCRLGLCCNLRWRCSRHRLQIPMFQLPLLTFR